MGGTRRTHAIINYEGENHLLSDEVKCPFDTTTHLYRFVLSADNTYGIFIDGEEKQTGSIEDGWDVLPPKMIKDPSESKPADWVDEQYIDPRGRGARRRVGGPHDRQPRLQGPLVPQADQEPRVRRRVGPPRDRQPRLRR